MDDLEDYFWRNPSEYRNFYDMKICGYLDMICIAIGFIPNIFTMIVLSREKMISPMNTIFSHIVFAASIAALGYIPRVWQEYFRVEAGKCAIAEHRTFVWEMISYHSYAVAYLFRHIAVWMALTLAVWRYIAVIHPLKERHWCNMENTRKCIIIGYFVMLIVCIPPYFAVGYGPAVRLVDENGCATSNQTIGKNITIYEFQIPAENYPPFFFIITFFWGVLLKIAPSIVFAIISFRLIFCLKRARERRSKMFKTHRTITYHTNIELQIRKKNEQTTKILIAILALFTIGEVPHGVYCVLSAYYGPKFFWTYYFYAQEIFNTVTHISESLNFVIYYAMSPQFRKTFKVIFCRTRNRKLSSAKSTQISRTSLSNNLSQSFSCTETISATTPD